MSAKDDPPGTLRRSKKGFSHLMKFCQPEDGPCWWVYDLYGDMEWLNVGPYTDQQVDDDDDTVVVYVPDSSWPVFEDDEEEGCP